MCLNYYEVSQETVKVGSVGTEKIAQQVGTGTVMYDTGTGIGIIKSVPVRQVGRYLTGTVPTEGTCWYTNG